MRALIVKFPGILGVIPMVRVERMASTLIERFNITIMTSAMTRTLTDEEAEEAIEKAKAKKAANKANEEGAGVQDPRDGRCRFDRRYGRAAASQARAC